MSAPIGDCPNCGKCEGYGCSCTSSEQDSAYIEQLLARIEQLEAALATARNDALREAEKAMREECTAPDGTYDMRTESEIAAAETATVEIASRTILRLITEEPS